MSQNFQNAYLQFRNFLERRRFEAQAEDFDPGRWVIENRLSKVGFGYVSGTLKGAYGSNLHTLFPKLAGFDASNFKDCDFFVVPGSIHQDEDLSHPGALKIFGQQENGRDVLFAEQGFLASSHSWSHSFKERDPNAACLGYVFDDCAHYFMADYPSRIVRKLNSSEELSEAQEDRARTVIARILRERISKYNAQPFVVPAMTEGFSKRVLVCDQAFGDASTVYGRIDEAGFDDMLLAALRENPDAEILVKTHPDTSWEGDKRSGYYSRLKTNGRIRVLHEPVNPFVLFDLVDKVYVGTSGMGLEALLAGKEVVTFGAPFYAGWGLTDDRQLIPHRHRERSLEDIFYYFYIWYTIYHVPGCSVPSEIEDALDHIERYRPYSPPPSVEELDSDPVVSVILPVYGVEQYIEEAITSIQRQTLREIEIITVNDVSPDGSQAIIDRLASQDPRIRSIVLKENIGQGFARNKAIDVARGTYIWFLDSDDIMASADHLETVVTTAERDGAQMVRGRKIYERLEKESGEFIRNRTDVTEQHFNEVVSATTFAKYPKLLHSRHFWNWLYRRDFLNEHDIRFVTTQWEERPFLLKALLEAKCLSTSLSEGVVYRVRQSSTARREKTARDYELQLQNFEAVMDLLQEAGAADKSSNLRRHAAFTLTQYLQYLFVNFPYQFAKDGRAGETADHMIGRVRARIEVFGFDVGELDYSAKALSQPHKEGFAFGLIFGAVLTNRRDLLDAAVALQPITQSDLYKVFLEAPETYAAQVLQDGLNAYARNDNVERESRSTRRRVRVIVHIGATKTGSTYLQRLFDENRAELLRRGIWFPEVGLFWQKDRPEKQAGHAHFTTAAVSGGLELRQHLISGLAAMGDQVHTIILSSEAYFLNPRSVEIARYLSDFDVEMVVYLRRQDEWSNAQYCEFVGGGAVNRTSKTISEWIQDPVTSDRLDYRSVLGRWERAIGRDKIHVRPFEKVQFKGGSLLNDFTETLALPKLSSELKGVDEHTNERSIDAGIISVLRHFNGLPFQDQRSYLAFIGDVSRLIAERRAALGLRTQKPILLSVAESGDLLRRYRECNAEIAHRYLNDQPMLFEDLEPKVAEADTRYIDSAEFEIIETTYQRYARKEERERVRLKEGSSPLQENARVVNLGAFGWRRVFIPFVRPSIERHADENLLQRFDEDPATFFAASKFWKHRLLSAVVFPPSNPYGLGGILRKTIVPALSYAIQKRAGVEMRRRFDSNPIVFVRTIGGTRMRKIGRLLLPAGEVLSA